jgi:hypothetical protein
VANNKKYYNLFLRDRTSYNLEIAFVIGAYSSKQAYKLACIAYKEIKGREVPKSIKITCSPPARRKSDLISKGLQTPKGTFIIYRGEILDLSSVA